MQNYVKKQFSRGFRNRIILLLIILAIIGYFTYKSLSTGILEPQRITRNAEVGKNLGVDNTGYVKFESVEIFSSGYYYTEDNKDMAKYYLVNLEDRYILALMPLDTEDYIEDYNFKAKIRVLDSIDKEVVTELREYAVSEYEWTEKEAALEIPSDYVVESLDYKSGYTFTFYAGLVIEAGLLLSIIYNGFYAIYPEKHRKYKKLERYGDIETVIETIDRDIEADNKYYDTKTVKIMENYTIEANQFGFNVHKTSEIMWIYKLITQHRYNGIPTGKTYSLQIKFAKKKEAMQIPMKNEATTDQIINDLIVKMPNVIYGFSQELADKYNKDFEGFKQDWETHKQNINA